MIEAVDSIKRRFFWKELDSQSQPRRQMPLIKWFTICDSKFHGGLGVVFLPKKNDALVSKWWYKFNKEKNSLWRRVLTGKYGPDSYIKSERIANRV